MHCGRLLDMRSDRQTRRQLVGKRPFGCGKKYLPTETRLSTAVPMLPGLIDCHVYLEDETSRRRYLREFTQNPATWPSARSTTPRGNPGWLRDGADLGGSDER
jgi:hypothetical protein